MPKQKHQNNIDTLLITMFLTKKKHNKVEINGIDYQLPNEPTKLRSIINHIDRVRNGDADFVKLTDIKEGKDVKLSRLQLEIGKINWKLDSIIK